MAIAIPRVWREIEAAEQPSNLDRLLQRAVARHPDRVVWAFIDEPEHHLARPTYSELDAAVDHMASVLSRLGVEAGSHVGVMLPNIPDHLARAGSDGGSDCSRQPPVYGQRA